MVRHNEFTVSCNRKTAASNRFTVCAEAPARVFFQLDPGAVLSLFRAESRSEKRNFYCRSAVVCFFSDIFL